jgi:predicted nucleic acid-binding protein
MNGYLLDTNVISEYSRPWPPDSGVRAWIDAQNEDVLHLSVLTLGEIRKGTTVLAAGRKRGDCGDPGRHGRTSATQRNHARHS